VESSSDYYPFGMAMAGRTYSAEGYRYGFNGKEKDDRGELGETSYDYGFRIYNPRIAKFLSVDPLTKQYPWFSPYQFAGNNPILSKDIDGLEPDKNVNKNEELSYSELNDNPDYAGLTVSDLRAQATENGAPGQGPNAWMRNIMAGNALEDAYSEFSGLERNFQLFTPLASDRKSQVRPDFVTPTIKVDDVRLDISIFPNGHFIEVKTTSIDLGVTLETSRGQIRGQLSALSKETSMLGTVKGRDEYALAMTLILPYETKLDQTVLTKATENNISLYVSYAFQNVNTGTVVFSIPELKNPELLMKKMDEAELEHYRKGYTPSKGTIEGVNINWSRSIKTWDLSNER
jgi:RHS repeat-associated protein